MPFSRLVFFSFCALLVSTTPGTFASCPTDGGCNRPAASKSNVRLTAGDLTYSTAPDIYASNNFSPLLRTAGEKGVNFVRDFIGSASHASLFFYEHGGVDSDYASVNQAWCEKTRKAGWCDDGSRNTAKAKDPTASGDFFMSGGSECMSACQEISHNSSPLAFVLGSSTTASTIEQRAVHEYVHAWQSAFTDQTPAWLMEGGAVFIECVHEAHENMNTFQDCFQTSGGRGGIIPNVRTVYGSSEAKWLTNFGADRCCGSDCPASRGDTTNSNAYYDVGALAVAFAIHKANATQDGTRTMLDFWRSTGTRGFWHNIHPWDGFDPMTSWPSNVPEGFGWKAALANFTGHSSLAAFYADFEEWVAPNGVVKSQSELLSILEADADVQNMSQTLANFSSFTVRNGTCSDGTGDGGGSGGGGSGFLSFSPASSVPVFFAFFASFFAQVALA